MYIAQHIFFCEYVWALFASQIADHRRCRGFFGIEGWCGRYRSSRTRGGGPAHRAAGSNYNVPGTDTICRRGLPSLVKGAGFRVQSCRSSSVRIAPLALLFFLVVVIVENHTFSKKSGFVINHRFNTGSTLVKVVSLLHYSYEHIFRNNQSKSLPVISIGLHFKNEWSS